MRKQFQIAAVVSAAALLAIGASMTSFAATGWQEEDGTWVYYNRAEERVTDQWAKSGDNWFYLDSDGYMATDMLIEDDDDYYYVDANGAMVRNQWIAIDNEDAGNDDDEPEVHWYYFQNNGKAYRKKSGNVFKKSINGKTYCFNEDGQMQYGWVDDDGNHDGDDSAWSVCDYYFGDENDGAMSVGWRLISLTDDVSDPDTLQPGDSFWDDDQDRWFYFKSSGKKEKGDPAKHENGIKTDKTVNGKKYGFDEYGRMVADWISVSASYSDATQGDADFTETFLYFSSPEDGARYTKGWFKVVPGTYLHTSKHDDGDNYWYYADGKGHIVASEIKSIKSKKYCFDGYGRMKKGLQFIIFQEANNYKDIEEVVADDDYSNDAAEALSANGKFYGYDTEDNLDDSVQQLTANLESEICGFYYFSNDEDHDGSMKTGRQTVTIDGDALSFRFYTSGAHKGMGITGVEDKKIYVGGKMISAGKDEKVEFYVLQDVPSTDIKKGDKVTISELMAAGVIEKDNATVSKNDEYSYPIAPEYAGEGKWTKYFIGVNTSGAILTSGTKKDGDDYKVTFRTEKNVSVLGKQVKAGYVDAVKLK